MQNIYHRYYIPKLLENLFFSWTHSRASLREMVCFALEQTLRDAALAVFFKVTSAYINNIIVEWIDN
ncbi:MAG: hypothetical protein LBH59_04385 [Planctomycetaceae bacterium]|nr:hypothetical protein [Planctomycetaceae bacterium]